MTYILPKNKIVQFNMRTTDDTSVSGTGEVEKRINEITPDNVAAFRNFVLGYNSDIRDKGGVLDIQGHNFNIPPTYITIPSGTEITFNDRIKALTTYFGTKTQYMKFTCDGVTYKRFFYNIFGQILYNNTVVYNLLTGWVDDKYKSITLTDDFQANEIVFNWLKSNSNLPTEKQYNTTVQISDGTCFAYGYMGHCEGREITFFPPAVEQYQIIYVEIDRSVIPNKVSIKTKNNQSSSQVLLNTFRQDELSLVKTGKFQVPLWLIKLSNRGIEELTSLRPLRKCIENVTFSMNTKHITKSIAANAEVEDDMKPLDTNDKTVATTEWVKSVIEQQIRR